MRKGLLQSAVLAAAIILVLALQARSAQERGESVTKVRTLICTIVSTPGSPYHFTAERWDSICGDLMPNQPTP